MTIALSLAERIRNVIWPPRPASPAYERREVADAERRWAEFNRRQCAAGCKCGRPATRVRYMPGATGSVTPESWTCDDHVGVNSWSGKSGPDGVTVWTPNWPRTSPCSVCDGWCGTMSRIGATPHEWACPKERQAGYEAEGFTRRPDGTSAIEINRSDENAGPGESLTSSPAGKQVDERCGETTVFWPDDECCDATCHLPKGHQPDWRHEDEILGTWGDE